MRVLFIVNATPQQIAEDQVRLASTRYRALMPARELVRLGLQVESRSFVDLMKPDFSCDADVIILQQPKIDLARIPLVLAEFYRTNVDGLQQTGRRLILDVSDFKLTAGGADDNARGVEPERLTAFRTLLLHLHEVSDAIVVPTATLGRLLAGHGVQSDKINVIPDPIEVRRGEPRFSPGIPLKLLWFGMLGSHWKALAALLQQDLIRIAEVMPLELHILCEPTTPDAVKRITGSALGRYTIRVAPWSVSMVEEALAASDIVVFPFDRSLFSAGKSNNRALQCLHAGRFVVAHPIDSYVELAEYCGVSEDLPTAITAALADPAGSLDRIRRGQEHVAKHYSPAAIGGRWADVISQVRAASSAA